MPENEARWDKYKDSISRAKKNYMSKKKSITLIFDPESYEEIKGYCSENDISMQSFFREIALDHIRSKNSAK